MPRVLRQFTYLGGGGPVHVRHVHTASAAAAAATAASAAPCIGAGMSAQGAKLPVHRDRPARGGFRLHSSAAPRETTCRHQGLRAARMMANGAFCHRMHSARSGHARHFRTPLAVAGHHTWRYGLAAALTRAPRSAPRKRLGPNCASSRAAAAARHPGSPPEAANACIFQRHWWLAEPFGSEVDELTRMKATSLPARPGADGMCCIGCVSTWPHTLPHQYRGRSKDRMQADVGFRVAHLIGGQPEAVDGGNQRRQHADGADDKARDAERLAPWRRHQPARQADLQPKTNQETSRDAKGSGRE